MSNVSHDKETSGSTRMHTGAKCSFCNEGIPTGYWTGRTDVYACPRCAVKVLPRLIADAATQSQLEDVFSFREKVEKELMIGLAIAASRQLALENRRYRIRRSREFMADTPAADNGVPPQAPKNLTGELRRTEEN
jgi:hypothetical protein